MCFDFGNFDEFDVVKKKQITRVELAYLAWEASILPMNYICVGFIVA